MTQRLLELTQDLEKSLRMVAAVQSLRRDEIKRTVQHHEDIPGGVHRGLQEPYKSAIGDSWGRIERLIADTGLVQQKSFRVVSYKDVPIPEHILDAYELLYIATYGSGALVIGDENSIQGAGKAERGRTRSDQVETRGGAVQKKKLSASRKDVIKNLRAYNFKVKVDKRLRRLAKEIRAELADTAVQDYYTRCSACKKVGDDDWKHCPRCGAEMERVES